MNDTERLIVAVKLLAEAVYNMSRNNGSPVNKLALRARDIADELAAVAEFLRKIKSAEAQR